MQFVPETEEQAALRKLAREVADRELAPRAAHWDETEEFPHDSWKAIAEAGLFGVTVGEDYGGAGLTDLESTIVLEELDLGRNPITDAGMSHLAGLKSLRFLALHGTQVTDSGLEPLRSLSSLEEIWIADGVSEEGLARFRAEMPSLKTVR